MGSSEQQSAQDVLAPLSIERIGAALDRCEFVHQFHHEDVQEPFYSARWNNMVVRFCAYNDGAWFAIIAQWLGSVPEESYSDLLEVSNQWSQEKRIPKPVVQRYDENQGAGIAAEHYVDCSRGITDEQVTDVIMGTLGTSDSLFKFVEEKFPNAWLARNESE